MPPNSAVHALSSRARQIEPLVLTARATSVEESLFAGHRQFLQHQGMSDLPPATSFLDPRPLIDSSRVAVTRIPGWPAMIVLLMVLFLLSSSSDEPVVRGLQFAVLPALMLLSVGLMVFRRRLAQRAMAETEAVAALEELMQLRRWPEAADLARRVLSQPMLMPDRRVYALMSLASLLSRYHRFEEARIVHDSLLDAEAAGLLLDPSVAHSIKVARAMSLLRDDHLVDADRAMTDLRREVNQARDDVRKREGSESARQIQSAGVVLLDLYRDVKTGHPQEALEVFGKAMPMLRDQLGIRIADAWVLAAMAYHMLGATDDARRAYSNATTLTAAIELHRRYPETRPLSEAYAATPLPSN